MCERSADNAFERIVEKLRSAASLLVITHARPDGDGLGSIAATARAARAAGKVVSLLVPGKIPARYGFLLPGARPAGAGDFAELADAAELIVIVDTCAQAQLDGLVDEVRRCREKIVVIDHHATVDDVGALRWMDTSAAASGVMIGELLEALDWPVDALAAEALMTAAVCDTGWLQFANTDARVLRAVAGWISAGVRPDVLYRKLFQSDRRERLGLMARVIESLDLRADGRLAVMTLRREDFEATGALPEETENLINESLRMKTVDTATGAGERGEVGPAVRWRRAPQGRRYAKRRKHRHAQGPPRRGLRGIARQGAVSATRGRTYRTGRKKLPKIARKSPQNC